MSDHDYDHRRRSFVCVLRGVVAATDPAGAVSAFLAHLSAAGGHEAIVLDRDLGDPGRLDGGAPLGVTPVGCLVEIASWTLEEDNAEDAIDMFRHLVHSYGLRDAAAVYVLTADASTRRFDPKAKTLTDITSADDRWWADIV